MITPSEAQRLSVRECPENERPVMFQTWSDLLFLHWRISEKTIQKTLPEGLYVDTFDDSAWLGVVPFKMRKIRPKGLFSVPWLSYFLELNVRTYVHDEQGRPGVWFYSLDTDRWLAYKIARTFFKLPYFPAHMSADTRDDELLDYRCRRTGEAGEEARFLYRPTNQSSENGIAKPGSLEFFLLERYLLFSHDAGKNKIYSGQVNHEPYRFSETAPEVWDSLPMVWDGFPEMTRKPDHAAVAESVDVSVFGLKPFKKDVH